MLSPIDTLPPGEDAVTIIRLLDAPPALVFKLWTDPMHRARWWGPRDCPATHITMDVRPGGRWRICLTRTEDGADLWQGGVFREIVPPDRLVFTFAWEEEGERGQETVVTVTFAERNGKTLMTFHHARFQSAGERDRHNWGWNSTFDRLVDYLRDN